MKTPKRHANNRSYEDTFSAQSNGIIFNPLSDDQIKISELPEASGLDGADLLPVVDISGQVSVTKKITLSNFIDSTLNTTIATSGDNIRFTFSDNVLYIHTSPTGHFDNLSISNKSGAGVVVFNSSPALTGTPTAPTANSGTNTKQIANTEFVRIEIANLINLAPGTLSTLNELAAAIANDPNYSVTIINQLATKANLSGASFSGTITSPTGDFVMLKRNGIDVSISGHSHFVNDISNFASGVNDLIPTVTNSGDNRILTSAGTSTGINAESNLTFDGTTLVCSGNARIGDMQYLDISNGSVYIKNVDNGPVIDCEEKSLYGDANIKSVEFGSRSLVDSSGISTLYWDTPSRIGILNNTPSYNLDVNGSGNFASGLVISNQTVNTIASFDGSKNVVSLSTETYPGLTELSYVKSVTSNIQTQLNSKQPSGIYASGTHTHTVSNITDFNSSISGLLPSKYPTVVQLGSISGTINTDANLGDIFDLTLTANGTLANPTNPTDGQSVRWRVSHNANSLILNFGDQFRIPSSATSPLSISSTSGSMDILGATYDSSRTKWDIIAFVPGY